MISLFNHDGPLLQQVVDVMVSATTLDKVYMYGASHQLWSAETIFCTSPVTREIDTSYDFLVLTAGDNKRRAPELTSLLENAVSKWVSASVFVLPIKEFNDWLRKAHPFACKVYDYALCCYDAGTIPLAEPGTYDNNAVMVKLREMLTQHWQRAEEFLQGAGLFCSRNNYPLAAFHLHQACEQLYTGMIQYVTGLRIVTHNLMKLYQHSRNLIAGLMDIFPMDTEQEKIRFKRLQAAYLGPRYQDNYCITAGEVALLRERVTQLSTLCQNLCHSATTTF